MSMRRFLLLILFALLFLTLTPAAAQCSPFTRQAQPGMLAIGTVVDIVNYEMVAPNTVAPVTRTGTVDEYYITTYCPQAAIFNMDAQAYVIKYGAVDGSRRIVSLRELTVR
jgi:hypothetical protein